MTEVLIKVGERYVTSEGKIVTIASQTTLRKLVSLKPEDDTVYSLFQGDNGIVYHGDGSRFAEGNFKCEHNATYYEDLMFKFVE
jgi:hypothetical protein